MKSKIKFINDDKESRIKKETIELIKEKIDNKSFHPSSYFYDLLIYSKYIIERDNLNVQTILDGDVDELIEKIKEECKIDNIFNILIKEFKDYKIYELIRKVIYEDYEIVIYNDRVINSYIDKKKKYLMVCKLDGYINYSNVDVYIPIPTLYLLNRILLYDKITGNKRNIFVDSNDIKFKDYETVFLINNKRKAYNDDYSIKKNFFDIKKLIMVCNYSEISKYYEGVLNIKTIMMDRDKTYIEYRILDESKRLDDSEYKTCIKELTNISDDNLKRIIDSDEEIENICIYTTAKDIKNNGCRIGFKAYNKKYNVDRTKALRLIDYNAKITHEIEELNKEISLQIDRLIVR